MKAAWCFRLCLSSYTHHIYIYIYTYICIYIYRYPWCLSESKQCCLHIHRYRADNLGQGNLSRDSTQKQTESPCLCSHMLPIALKLGWIHVHTASIHAGTLICVLLERSYMGNHTVETSWLQHHCYSRRHQFVTVCSGPLALTISLLSVTQCSISLRCRVVLKIALWGQALHGHLFSELQSAVVLSNNICLPAGRKGGELLWGRNENCTYLRVKD